MSNTVDARHDEFGYNESSALASRFLSQFSEYRLKQTDFCECKLIAVRQTDPCAPKSIPLWGGGGY